MSQISGARVLTDFGCCLRFVSPFAAVRCRLAARCRLPPSREGISAPTAHQQHVGLLQFVIVAELELICLRHDQSLVRLAENTLLFQSIGASPHGFDRQIKETGESGTGNTPLDIVGLDGLDRAESAIKFGVLHHVDHVGVEDRVNEEQIQMIEVVVAEHFAGCTQHVGQRMA